MQTINTTPPLQRTVLILFLFFLVFSALYFAKAFLIPVTFAAILSMLFYPICKWLEAKGIGRGLASFLCILSFVLIMAGLISLLVWQLSGMAAEMSGMQEKITKQVDAIQLKLQTSFGVPREKQEQFIQKQQQSAGGGLTTTISHFLSSLGSFLVDTILALVYIFLFLYLRSHLRKFVLKLVNEAEHERANKVIFDSSKISQKHFAGTGKMIVVLWIMYGIGFSVIGVKNAIFFAILCGLLEIIPFIGNLAGTSLTIIATFAQGGSTNLVIGIIITYALVQFIQTYVLEPMIVGSAENINPLFTIIILVVGELVWGIPGMVLALPLLGITKVVFDNITPLQPYGFLVGEEKKKDDEDLGTKIKKVFK
jgi:predicted PurR-regulated permease PerM